LPRKGTWEESATEFDPLDYVNEVTKLQEENCKLVTKIDQFRSEIFKHTQRLKEEKISYSKTKELLFILLFIACIATEKLEEYKKELGVRETEMRTKMEKLEIIAKEAAKVRRRFFANSMGFYKKGGSWVKATSSLDRAAGNNATHRGNIEIDALLIEMGLLDEKLYAPLLDELYITTLEIHQHARGLGTKHREILNLDGTLRSCFSFTSHSHSSSLDKRFLELRHEALDLHRVKDLCTKRSKDGRPVCTNCVE
jgi:hypothetical protein